MKRTFLTAVLCLAGIVFANAQSNKGTLFFGTSIESTTYSNTYDNYSLSDGNFKTNHEKAFDLSFNPTVGVFLTNHLIFGGTIGITHSYDKTDLTNTDILTSGTQSSNGITTDNTTGYSIGPFVRYYIFDGKPGKTLFYLQGNTSVGTGSGHSDYSYHNSVTSNTSDGNINGIFSWQGGGSVGVTHFFGKNVGLDFAAGYAYTHEKFNEQYNNNPSNTDYTASANSGTYGFTLGLGFHFFMPK
jgi:hypothetical protein